MSETLPLPFHEPMLFAADSRARTLQAPACAPESTATTPGYGVNSPELLASYDRATSLWKTSQLCLDGELAVYSETWPRSGLMRSGIAYRLPPLVPITDATACGLWPTPCATESRQGFQNRTRGKRGTQESLTTVACKTLGLTRGALNPTWVEWLMGFPLAWTVLDALEMPSSRKFPKC
jgi:hypothetical protein